MVYSLLGLLEVRFMPLLPTNGMSDSPVVYSSLFILQSMNSFITHLLKYSELMKDIVLHLRQDSFIHHITIFLFVDCKNYILLIHKNTEMSLPNFSNMGLLHKKLSKDLPKYQDHYFFKKSHPFTFSVCVTASLYANMFNCLFA